MLYSIILFIFVIICLLLVGIILLQTSQSGGMGSIGGSNSYLESALGSQGADSLLLRTTTVLAIIFMSLAILLNLEVIENPASKLNYSTESILDKNKTEESIPVETSIPTESNNIISKDALEETNENTVNTAPETE